MKILCSILGLIGGFYGFAFGESLQSTLLGCFIGIVVGVLLYIWYDYKCNCYERDFIDYIKLLLNPRIADEYYMLLHNFDAGVGKYSKQENIPLLRVMSYNDMKKICDAKSIIIKLHKEFIKKVEDRETASKLKEQYPHAFISICNKYNIKGKGNEYYNLSADWNYRFNGKNEQNNLRMPGEKVSNYKRKKVSPLFDYFLSTPPINKNIQISNLDDSDIQILIKNKTEFEILESNILIALQKEDIDIKFDDEILDNPLRKEYVNSFLLLNQRSESDKEYAVSHISELDCYINSLKKTEISRSQLVEKKVVEIDRFQIAEKEKKQQEINKFKNYVSNWHTHQWNGSVKHIWYCDYYSYQAHKEVATFSMWDTWHLIWNFKNSPEKNISAYEHSKALNIAVEWVEQILKKTFLEDTQNLTLVCLTASTKEKNDRRFRDFAQKVCNDLNMYNAFDHINIVTDGEAKHEGGTIGVKKIYDKDWFNNKIIVLFDDVRTSGISIENEKEVLESFGATVICAVTLGQTVHS